MISKKGICRVISPKTPTTNILHRKNHPGAGGAGGQVTLMKILIVRNQTAVIYAENNVLCFLPCTRTGDVTKDKNTSWRIIRDMQMAISD